MAESVDEMRDLEKRFKETRQELQKSQLAEVETKQALQKSLLAEAETKRALQKSLRAEAETKKSLQESGKHLTDEKNKNSRQGVIIARLNARIEDADNELCTLRRATSKLETEYAQLKLKLDDLQNLEIMQEDMRLLKTSVSLISEQLMNKFKSQDEKQDEILLQVKAQDEKQDEILLQGSKIMAIARRIETMHDVAFSGGSGNSDEQASNESDGEEDGVGFKRRRTEDLDALL